MPMPEFIDPVLDVKMIIFAKTSSKRSFSIQSVPRDVGNSLFWTRIGGGFQILGLRRGRDQQVFMPRTQSINGRSFLKNGQGKYLWMRNKNICNHNLLCYSISKIQFFYTVHSDSSTKDFLNWLTQNERKHSRYVGTSFIVLFTWNKNDMTTVPEILCCYYTPPLSCLFTLLFCTPPCPPPSLLVADNYYLNHTCMGKVKALHKIWGEGG